MSCYSSFKELEQVAVVYALGSIKLGNYMHPTQQWLTFYKFEESKVTPYDYYCANLNFI